MCPAKSNTKISSDNSGIVKCDIHVHPWNKNQPTEDLSF